VKEVMEPVSGNQTNEEINVKLKPEPHDSMGRLDEELIFNKIPENAILTPIGLHPPRGYINREDWIEVYERCDPNDRQRQVRAHFVPHVEYQLPEMFAVMPVSEHEEIVFTYKDLLKMKDAEINEFKADVTNRGQLLNEAASSYREVVADNHIAKMLLDLSADGELAKKYAALKTKLQRAEEALEKIAKKKPYSVSKAEAADMACEFNKVASQALAENSGTGFYINSVKTES
jgi:hypothetical protein